MAVRCSATGDICTVARCSHKAVPNSGASAYRQRERTYAAHGRSWPFFRCAGRSCSGGWLTTRPGRADGCRAAAHKVREGVAGGSGRMEIMMTMHGWCAVRPISSLHRAADGSAVDDNRACLPEHSEARADRRRRGGPHDVERRPWRCTALVPKLASMRRHSSGHGDHLGEHITARLLAKGGAYIHLFFVPLPQFSRSRIVSGVR
jgi:hypothetical protein